MAAENPVTHFDRALQTRFVLIGMGGLGCPALAGLLCAGARDFVLVDPDCVELSNLHRQCMYSMADRGVAKALAAARWIEKKDPEACIEVHRRAFGGSFGRELLQRHLRERGPQGLCVLECSDSSTLKFEVNDLCQSIGITGVIGGALGFSGQISALLRQAGCLRCLFESPPDPQNALRCDQAGVCGSVTAVIGQRMAATALSIVRGELQIPVMRSMDFKSLRSQELPLRPRKDCPACAHNSP